MAIDIVSLIAHEEGWREKPYLCSEGYPTVGFGVKIGPKGAPISNYTFTLPQTVGAAWLHCILNDTVSKMRNNPIIAPAYARCVLRDVPTFENPRLCILISMAYQMGIDGLAGFTNTLRYIADGNWQQAAKNMLASKWAKQTPNRARRHAEQIQTGKWCKEY